MSRFGRGAANVVCATALILALTSCTPSTPHYWLLSQNGELSTAWCHNLTIESLTVSLYSTGSTSEPLRAFTVEGPSTFIEEGEPVTIGHIAEGWSDAPRIDLDGEWSRIVIESGAGDYVHDPQSVDRSQLEIGEWVADPEPGLFAVPCDLAD